MKKIISLGAILGFTPLLTFAAVQNPDAFSLLGLIANFLAMAIPVLITVAVVYFIWGVIQYSLSSSEEAKKKNKGIIIQGLIGLFVIVAFWGILKLVTDTTGVGPGVTPVLPCIPNPSMGIECFN